MGSEQFNGWESVYNDGSKDYYYQHLKTGNTQWETPKNWIKHINDSDGSVYYQGPDGATTRTQPVKIIKNFSRKLLTQEQFDQLVIPHGWKKYFSEQKVYFTRPGEKETTFDLEILTAGDAPVAAVEVAAAPKPLVAASSVAAAAPKPIDFSKKLLTKEQFDQLIIPPGWKKYSMEDKDQKDKLKVYFTKPGKKETTWILEHVAAAAPTATSVVAAAAPTATSVVAAAAVPKPSVVAAQPKPSAPTAAPTVAAAAAVPKPSVAAAVPKPSVAAAVPKPSVVAAVPKPSVAAAVPTAAVPTAVVPKPSAPTAAPTVAAAAVVPKPSVVAAVPKPSVVAAAAVPKPSVAAAVPKPSVAAAVPTAAVPTAVVPKLSVASAAPSAVPKPSVASAAPKPIDFEKKLLTKEQFDQLVIPPGWKKYSMEDKDQKDKLKVYFTKPGQKETTWILEPVAAAKPLSVPSASGSAAANVPVSVYVQPFVVPVDRLPEPVIGTRLTDWTQIEPWINEYCRTNSIELNADESVRPTHTFSEAELLAIKVEYNYRVSISDIEAQTINGWQTLDSVGDGTCMIHALLQAISPTYRKIKNKKSQVGTAFRKTIFANEFYTKKEIGDLRSSQIEYAHKQFVQGGGFLESFHMERFCEHYKINIYALVRDTGAYFTKFYGQTVGPSNSIYEYPLICIFNNLPFHFETISVAADAPLILEFPYFARRFPALIKTIRLDSEAITPYVNEMKQYLEEKGLAGSYLDKIRDIFIDINGTLEQLITAMFGLSQEQQDAIIAIFTQKQEAYAALSAQIDRDIETAIAPVMPAAGAQLTDEQLASMTDEERLAYAIKQSGQPVTEEEAAMAAAIAASLANQKPASEPNVNVVAQIEDPLKGLPPVPGSIENLRRKYNEEVAAYIKLSGIERIQNEYAKYLEIPEGEKKTAENQNKCHKINFYFVHLINNIYVNIYKSIIAPYIKQLSVAKTLKIYDDTNVNKHKEQLGFFRDATLATFQLSKVPGGDPCAGTFSINNDFHKLYNIFITQLVPELNKAIGAYNNFMAKTILQPITDDTIDKIIKDAHDKAANSLFSATIPQVPKSKGGLRRRTKRRS